METAWRILLVAVLAFLVLCLFFSLIRTIRGPRRADRILGVNMIGSLSTASLAVLAVLLQESWLLDVCLVYCLISFLTVVLLARIHIRRKLEEREEHDRA